jgi:hypothetical protein
MIKLLLGLSLTLFSLLFGDDDIRYIYLSDYDAYIKVFNCAKPVVNEIENDRKLVIVPKKRCNDLYIKILRKVDSKILEEGLYRCDTTTKDVNIESRNDNGSTYFIRKYYVPKRIGKWIFYENGKKIVRTY